MAQTFLSAVQEGPRKYPERKRAPGGSTYNLRSCNARPPWRGAARETTDRVVQWMYDTEKAILLYDFAGDCHYWLPRWLWPRGAVVEMMGEAGPVEIPHYVVDRLRLT